MSTKKEPVQIREEIEKLKETLINKTEELFKEGCKELFKKYPSLICFHWTGFTPYFNDGEPCTFISNHCYFDLDLDDDEFEEAINKDVKNFLSNFDDDDMLIMFGDHVSVVVGKDTIEVQEYSDHD